MLQFSVIPKAELPPLRIEPFKGINLAVTPTQIDQSQSPDMLNMNIDERGALNKRTGYERLFYRTLGNGPINGMFYFKNALLVAHGTQLYKINENEVTDSMWADDDLDEPWEV
jgi:hypothetical protein